MLLGTGHPVPTQPAVPWPMVALASMSSAPVEAFGVTTPCFPKLVIPAHEHDYSLDKELAGWLPPSYCAVNGSMSKWRLVTRDLRGLYWDWN